MSKENEIIPENKVSDIHESDSWFDASPDITNRDEVVKEHSLDIISANGLNTLDNPPVITALENIEAKIKQILIQNPTYFPTLNENPSENLDQIMSFISNLQKKIVEIQR